MLNTLPENNSKANVKYAFVPVTTTFEYGEHPEYAQFKVDACFSSLISRLQSLCKVHGLSEVRTWASPDAWCPEDAAEDLRLTSEEIVVTSDSFWFVASPKHSEYYVETCLVGIDEFFEAMAGESDCVYFGDLGPDDVDLIVPVALNSIDPSVDGAGSLA